MQQHSGLFEAPPPSSGEWLVAGAALVVTLVLPLLLQPWLPTAFPSISYLPALLLLAALAGARPAISIAWLALAIAWLQETPAGLEFGDYQPALLPVLGWTMVATVSVGIVHHLSLLTRQLKSEREHGRQLHVERAAAVVDAWHSRERLDVLMRQVPLGVIEIDRLGTLRLFNDRARLLLGHRNAHATTSILALVHLDDRAALASAIDRQMAGAQPETLALRPADPGLQPLLLHLAVARDPESRPQSVLASVEKATSASRAATMASA